MSCVQEPDPLKPDGTPADWFKDGLLWAVNRTLLHPRGFALAVDPAKAETLVLYGKGDAPWAFSASISEIEDAKFGAFEALLQRARESNQ